MSFKTATNESQCLAFWALPGSLGFGYGTVNNVLKIAEALKRFANLGRGKKSSKS